MDAPTRSLGPLEECLLKLFRPSRGSHLTLHGWQMVEKLVRTTFGVAVTVSFLDPLLESRSPGRRRRDRAAPTPIPPAGAELETGRPRDSSWGGLTD